MRWLVVLLALALLLSTAVPLAIAARIDPAGSCPDGFQRQALPSHGEDAGQANNGNRSICTRPISGADAALTRWEDDMPRVHGRLSVVIIFGA